MSKKCQHILGAKTYVGCVRVGDNLSSWEASLVQWWKFCPLCGANVARAKKKAQYAAWKPITDAITKAVIPMSPFTDLVKPGKFPKNLGSVTSRVGDL